MYDGHRPISRVERPDFDLAIIACTDKHFFSIESFALVRSRRPNNMIHLEHIVRVLDFGDNDPLGHASLFPSLPFSFFAEMSSMSGACELPAIVTSPSTSPRAAPVPLHLSS